MRTQGQGGGGWGGLIVSLWNYLTKANVRDRLETAERQKEGKINVSLKKLLSKKKAWR